MLNKIILVGRLGKDAAQRGTTDKPIVAFTLAVSTPMGHGERDTQWFNCAGFGSTAKFLGSVMPKKGQLVLVEGKMKKREYIDAKGIERESLDVVIENFQFLERKSDAPAPSEQAIGGEAQWQPRWDDSPAPPRDPRDLWK